MNTSRSSRSGAAFTLIELLVVISIIAILASLAMSAIQGAQLAAKRAQAKNDMSQIAGAVTAYYTEYGRYPILTGISDVVYGASATGNDQVVSVLRNKKTTGVTQTVLDTLNPRQIKFIEPKVTDSKKAGVNDASGKWLDPWGLQFIIFIDGAYDDDITVTSAFSSGFATNPPVGVGVASVGYYYAKNKKATTPDYLSASKGYDKTTDLLSWQ